MSTEVVELIIMAGVWGNVILQANWFIWSYKEHHRKHYLDDAQEIDMFDKVNDFYNKKKKEEIEAHKAKLNWKEFDPEEKKEPERDQNGKYNHREIDGHFDSFFIEDQG